MSLALLQAASDEELIQRSSESLRFPGGEWLIHESWRAAPQAARTHPQAQQRRHEVLHFQNSTRAPREALGEIALRDAGATTLREAQPQLLRSSSRCALVLGRYVFQRWERAQGPWWYRVTTQPFGAAAFFLRACLREFSEVQLSLPEVPYGFGHLDLERNVLVTSREQPDRRFPQYLVYSAPAWGSPWQFDAERTRRVNGMPRA
ncbi:MAG TPA: hypothetical protein VNX47_13905 [Nevskia sp.]|nr:hypothetical protein [Nevskia sp.]